MAARDEDDAAILARIHRVYTQADPPPADLDDRVLFAIALDTVDLEVARLQVDQLVGSGARGGESTRTVTFEAGSLSILVSIVDLADGHVRVDGWLAPPAAHRVQLRLGAGTDAESHQVAADEGGRFVFPAVGHGLVQLLVHAPAGEEVGSTTSVVTPSFIL